MQKFAGKIAQRESETSPSLPPPFSLSLEDAQPSFQSLGRITDARPQDTCTSLERDVDRTQRDVAHLTCENEQLSSKVQGLEMQVRCQICYEARRNCLLMPCLHFCFCAHCMERHFSASETRQCPICRNAVSGVIVMQLEQE